MKTLKTLTLLLFISACDILHSDLPLDEIPGDLAIQTEGDLRDLLNGSYDVVANYKNGLSQRLAELIGDNIDGTNITGFLREVYIRNTNIFNEDVQGFYQQPYFAIHRVNLILEAIDDIDLSENDRKEILAEARLIRGVAHFDAVNLMAHPPGYTSDNSHLGVPLRFKTGAQPVVRSSVDETYNAIIKDLRYAEKNLPTNNGIYATSYSAQGLLAKVYFMKQNYDSAIHYASQVLNNTALFGLTNDINARYSQNITREHVFYTVSTGINDNRASVFTGSYRSDLGGEPFLKVTQEFYELATDNTSDLRSDWFSEVVREDGSSIYVSNKFNKSFLNVAIVHVVELLLTRAESYAILDQNLDLAIEDINSVRTRANISGISPVSNRNQILEAVRNERRIELSLEGDRIFQLKRRGAEGEDIIIRGANWDCPGQVLVFPNEELFPDFTNNPQGGC